MHRHLVARRYLVLMLLAGLLSFVTRTQAQTVNRGDTVTVLATLSTSDGSEASEGEPCLIKSTDGGFSVSDTTYNTTMSYTYQAAGDGDVPVQSWGGEAPDGDEKLRCLLPGGPDLSG
jgi:hypothetical protein